MRAHVDVTTAESLRHPPKPRLVLHVGVTGHRHDDLAGRDVDAIRTTVATVLRRLSDIVAGVHQMHAEEFDAHPAVRRIFSRLADGADLIVAEAAVQQGYELHCPLPFPRAEYAAHIPDDWKPLYHQMLEASAGILELDGEVARRAGRSESLEAAFFESRRMVLRHSDVLIAIWDPEDCPSQVWGTTRLVHEARHDDLLVVHIDPRKPGEFHLDVREADADIHDVPPKELEEDLRFLLAPPPGSSKPGVLTRWLGGSTPYRAFLAERQRTWTVGAAWLILRDLMHRGRLTWPRVRVAGALERARTDWATLWTALPPLADHVRHQVDRALLVSYAWADTLADHYANLTRSSIVLNYLMAAGAVALALAGYALGWTHENHPAHAWAVAWIVGELVLILLIVANTYLGNAQRWHERWMDYRVLAERIRLQRVLAPLGRITPHTRRPAHLSFGDLRGTWVGWYFRALVRDLGMIGGRYDDVHVEAARAVLVKLLADDSAGQIGWHQSNARRCHTVEARLHIIGLGLFIATGIVCAVHLWHHWPWLTLAAATLPAVGAAMGAIAMHTHLDRVAKHSAAMAEHLEQLRIYLQRQPARAWAVGRPCEEIADCMTTEVLDWRSLFRGKIILPA
jgi:hypothetical protein